MKKFASILLSMLMATGAIAAASAETYTGTCLLYTSDAADAPP